MHSLLSQSVLLLSLALAVLSQQNHQIAHGAPQGNQNPPAPPALSASVGAPGVKPNKKIKCFAAEMRSETNRVECEYGCKIFIYNHHGPQASCINDPANAPQKGELAECFYDPVRDPTGPVHLCYCTFDLCNSLQHMEGYMSKAKPLPSGAVLDTSGVSPSFVPVLTLTPLTLLFL